MSNVPKSAKPSGAREALRAGWARLGEMARPGSHRMLLAVAVVCLGVLVAGVSIAVFSQPSGSQAHHAAAASNPAPASDPARAASGAARPKAQAPASHASTGTKVTSDGIAKTALQWPPRLTHKIVRWAKGRGGAALAAVTAQLGNSMQAANLKLYPQMRQSCADLSTSVAAARAAPPIPDAAMQRLYARTLTGIDRAAAHCRRAVRIEPGDETTETHLNHPLLNRTRVEFAAMSARLYRATAEIRSLLAQGR